MEEAIFNEHGSCINSDTIKTFGNKDVFYKITAARYQDRVIATSECKSTGPWHMHPLGTDSLDFADKKEAICYYSKRAENWAMRQSKKEMEIIMKSIEDSFQPELF